MSRFRKTSQLPSRKLETTNRKEQNTAITIDNIKDAFSKCSDVIIKPMCFSEDPSSEIIFVYNEGLANLASLNEEIIPGLEEHLSSGKRVDTFRKKITSAVDGNMNILTEKVFNGELILVEMATRETFSINISKPPQREPEEPNTEISILGPRDGFIEEIEVNIALLRKRLPTTSLVNERFIIGDRSQTKVSLMYFEDIIREDMIDHVRESLEDIDIDALLSTQQLEEILTESSFRLFPMYQNSGRPDYVADALLRGRFVMFIDGLPQAVLAPVNLTLMLKTAEDAEYTWLYNSFERLLRLLGISVATFLPGFWVALSSFHQDQLPFILLASVSESRQGVPLPAALEAFVLIGLFELFREAGLRLPLAVGQILAVVGGLIIGDAAINAGLTNPVMVVIVATSAVSTFTLVSPALQGTVTILRLFILGLSSIIGIFGFFVGIFMILIYVSHLRSYSIPYMAPLAPLRIRDSIFTIFRPSWKKQSRRPSILHTGDEDRREGR
ncbi:spore germination protein [Alteribacillus sp. HJP-4]|uniref:spore germination protein n=1 Tax=Alteribacillus sp. HJP-4 TaxID=2775394 RepID=UPI0035CCE5ED